MIILGRDFWCRFFWNRDHSFSCSGVADLVLFLRLFGSFFVGFGFDLQADLLLLSCPKVAGLLTYVARIGEETLHQRAAPFRRSRP